MAEGEFILGRIQNVGSISNFLFFASHAMKKISVTLGIAPRCFIFSPTCLLDSLLSESLLFMHCFFAFPLQNNHTLLCEGRES